MRREVLFRLVSVSLLFAFAACGSSNAQLKVIQADARENASVEICLARVTDLESIEAQTHALLLQRPLGAGEAGEWLASLSLGREKAEAYARPLRAGGVYGRNGAVVQPLKILTLHSAAVLAEPPAQPGEDGHETFFEALDHIGGDHGTRAKRDYLALEGLRRDWLELEAQRGVMQKKKREAEIAELSLKIKARRDEMAPVEAQLLAELQGLAAVPLPEDARPLAHALFLLARYVAQVESEAVTHAALVILQAERLQEGADAETLATLRDVARRARVMGQAAGYRAKITRGLATTLGAMLGETFDDVPAFAAVEGGE